MTPQQIVTAHVLSVIDEKRICVRLDKQFVETISSIVSKAYDHTVVKDTIVVNISNCHIDLSIDWAELSDLIGMHLNINMVPRNYQYWRTKSAISNGINNITNTKFRGVTFNARRITNILI